MSNLRMYLCTSILYNYTILFDRKQFSQKKKLHQCREKNFSEIDRHSKKQKKME